MTQTWIVNKMKHFCELKILGKYRFTSDRRICGRYLLRLVAVLGAGGAARLSVWGGGGGGLLDGGGEVPRPLHQGGQRQPQVQGGPGAVQQQGHSAV